MKSAHVYIEEAGDTTFYGKKRQPLLGTEGVSKIFMLGMLKFGEDNHEAARRKVLGLQSEIVNSPYFKNVPSVLKRQSRRGYFLHAKDDLPEIRLKAYEAFKQLDCTFKAIVARKNYGRFALKHKSNEEEFYADTMSHLLKDELRTNGKLVINLAYRGKSTRQQILSQATSIAEGRFIKNTRSSPNTHLLRFNIQDPLREPLLVIVDYFNWAIQRVFERGETRFYDFIADKISVVKDIYDKDNFAGKRNHYTAQHPLTEANRIEIE